jgi:hypothetical protein
VSGHAGPTRTFDPALVPLALERRERTGETWRRTARDLGVDRGSLRNRCAEYLRGVHKIDSAPVATVGTPSDPSEAPDYTSPDFVHTSGGRCAGPSKEAARA